MAGVRIADFGIAWAGGHIGTILSFLGAEVIKIENRMRPEHSRRFSWTTGQSFPDVDRSAVFNDINLNKLGITIDLKQSKGIELAKEIVKISDVLIENLRPGRMESFGLGYDMAREVKADIIYLSSSGEGGSGPHQKFIGYASTFGALSGLSYITGYADGDPAEFWGESDLVSAFSSAFAILVALNYRQKTGEGQYINLSSTEAISVLMGDVLMDYTMNGRVQSRIGNRNDFMAPHNCYRCQGEDKWISIAIATDEEWRAFCNVIGNPEWTKQRKFSDAHGRWQNQEELDRLVTEWTSKHTHYEVMEILQQSGVAAIPSLNSQELSTEPHLRERGFWIDVEHPLMGKRTVSAPPWKLSATPAGVYRHGPLLGEHNQYVFGELLGLPATEIAQLVAEKVIY